MGSAPDARLTAQAVDGQHHQHRPRAGAGKPSTGSLLRRANPHPTPAAKESVTVAYCRHDSDFAWLEPLMSYRETEHLRSPTRRSAAAIAGSHSGFRGRTGRASAPARSGHARRAPTPRRAVPRASRVWSSRPPKVGLCDPRRGAVRHLQCDVLAGAHGVRWSIVLGTPRVPGAASPPRRLRGAPGRLIGPVPVMRHRFLLGTCNEPFAVEHRRHDPPAESIEGQQNRREAEGKAERRVDHVVRNQGCHGDRREAREDA